MCLIADKRLRQASPTPLRVLLSCLRISFVRYDCRKLALCRPLAASARLLCEVFGSLYAFIDTEVKDLYTRMIPVGDFEFFD